MRDLRLFRLQAMRQSPARGLDAARTAGARLAEREPSLDRLNEEVKDLGDMPEWAAFETGFAAALDDALRQEWAELLRPSFELRRENLDGLYGGEHVVDHLRGQQPEWEARRNIEPWEALRQHRPETFPSDPLAPRLLIQVHQPTWIAAMEEVRSPSWFDALAQASSVTEDPVALIELVAMAPPAFNDTAPTGNVLALAVSRWVVEYVGKVHSALAHWPEVGPQDGREAATAEVTRFESEELPDFYQRAFGVLLARDDGDELARDLLVHLAELCLRPAPTHRRRHPFDLNLAALTSLARAARVSGLDIKSFEGLHWRRERARRDWQVWQRDHRAREEKRSKTRPVRPLAQPRMRQIGEFVGEGRRLNLTPALSIWMAVAAIVFEPDAPQPADMAVLWLWLSHVLKRRDPALTLLDGDGEEARRAVVWMAGVLAALSEPEKRWTHVYDKLEPQRRRASFGHRYEDSDATLPSRLLLRVGLYACDMLSRDKQDQREALFASIEQRARRLWLTSTGHRDSEARTYAACFQLVPSVFGDDAVTAVSKLWKTSSLGPQLLCAAAVGIHRSGMSASQLLDAARHADIDLLAAFDSERTWAEVKTRPFEYPDNYAACAAELARAAQEGQPSSEKTTRPDDEAHATGSDSHPCRRRGRIGAPWGRPLRSAWRRVTSWLRDRCP